MDPADAKPLREVHYYVSTGAKVGEKEFTYDGNGKLVHELFTSELTSSFSFERFYEYDFHGNLVKTREGTPGSEYFQVFEKTYHDGLMVSDRSYHESNSAVKPGHQYFYTFHRLDSAWEGLYAEDGSFHYQGTKVYSYDDAGNLIRETGRDFKVCGTTYTYDDGNKLITTCYGCEYPVCYANEYNSAGMIIKISMRRPLTNGFEEAVIEERFYTGERLTKKLLTDFPMYGAFDQPLVTEVRYEY
jgi:hypothetical protein